MNGDYVFIIQINCGSNGLYTQYYTIWTENEEYINRFIQQHSLEKDAVYVTPILIDELEGIPSTMITESNELNEYYFKSNKDDSVHTIVTTEKIVSSAVEAVGKLLTDSLLFGDLVMREDIQFVKKISDLIEKLPYASIYDWSLLEEIPGDGYYSDYAYSDYTTNYKNYTVEEMFRRHKPGQVEPITLEAYVHQFVKFILTI